MSIQNFARALAALHAVKATLERENDKQGGPINDTIWHTDHETLFDFIENELSAIEGRPDSPQTGELFGEQK